MLSLDGHRVEIARDGRSGLEAVRRVRPDLVLCDIGLPNLNGYEVARAVREDGALRLTRLVALSGYAQPEDRKRCREAGFDGPSGEAARPRYAERAPRERGVGATRFRFESASNCTA